MLIQNAEVSGSICDVRIDKGLITQIGARLETYPAEERIDADGGALLPGLHDHHVHLNATAAALASVRCGPPYVNDQEQLSVALQSASGEGWLRGIGYHPCIGVELDRDWLDRNGPARPIRIQHRSGRLWILNSLAAELFRGPVPADGRLIDQDDRIRKEIGSTWPDLGPVGRALALFGVTAVTEMTARNGLADFQRFAEAGLPQKLLVMGGQELENAPSLSGVQVGGVKLHYHDHDLPDLDGLTAEVARAHAAGRPIASHCVTRAELILTLASIEAAGPCSGDRIEHGAVIPPDIADWIAALGLTVVSQPHFLIERGAAYCTDVSPDDRPWLYRLGGLSRRGIRIAAGSDSPFGGLNPWRSMAAAVARPPEFNPAEALTPEQALALYTGTADAPGGPVRRVSEGEPADVCLIDRPWRRARDDLAAVEVRATFVGGVATHSSIASTSPHPSATGAGNRRMDRAR